MDTFNRASDISKLVTSDENVKLDILAKYGIMSDVIFSGENRDIINNNIDTFKPLISKNIIQWVITEKTGTAFKKVTQTSIKLPLLFEDYNKAVSKISELASSLNIQMNDWVKYESVMSGLKLFGIETATDIDLSDIEIIDDNDDDKSYVDGMEFEDDDIGEYVDNKEEYSNSKGTEPSEYNEKIHGIYRQQIEELVLTVWEDMYGYNTDGREVIDGFIVPGGALLSKGESEKYQGILKMSSGTVIEPNTISNAVYKEFIEACKECSIPMITEVADDVNDIKPFKYNPLMQKKIAMGEINKQEFKKGWKSYKEAIKPYISNKIKELAVIKYKSGSDTEIYNEISGYIISLAVVNYQEGLGTQLRICCGDTSKTKYVAEKLVQKLRDREKTDKSIAQGKMKVANCIVSESGLSATINMYLNMAGYQAIPQFMGELLYNLQEGKFQPSLKNMIIGKDLNNHVVTAPFTKWLLPIIAGSRAGKGVLTLSMLINVIGVGAPLFYLDGKPDMATLLWKLQKKYNIEHSMVIDGIGYSGVTTIDRKRYEAPYINNIAKAQQSDTADELLEANFGVMFYLKTMMVVMLSTKYYKDVMNSKYGELFVVFDELFAVMKSNLETFLNGIDTTYSCLDSKSKDRKAELNKIKMWITNLLQSYISSDIGLFGAGIKAVALTQFAQDIQYNVPGFSVVKTFCTNFLLKRAVKLFGRQEGGTGTYGVQKDKDESINFDLYDKYFHFGIGTEQGNTYNNLKTFKPLLVLNENDCMELTGNGADGAFTADMISRVAMYSDVNVFRDKYFKNKALAESIGFEGALKQMGRLLGKNHEEMIGQSMEKAYEISYEALKYYGIIGTDNIEDVYDYICSFETKHLWTYNEIIRARAKGITPDGKARNTNDLNKEHDGEQLFSDINNDDEIDFGNIDNNTDEVKEDNQTNIFNDDTNRQFAGTKREFTEEERYIIDDINNRRNNNKVFDAKPEIIDGTERNTFSEDEKSGEIKIDPKDTDEVIGLNNKNSISVDNFKSSFDEIKNKMFQTLRGSEHEFKSKWGTILNIIANKINKDTVSRVMLVQDEMYVNGRFVATKNILGGFANIRLEDIVDIKALFRKFRNISDLIIDNVILERLQLENNALPQGLFAMSSKLLRITLIDDKGNKLVMDRNSAISKDAQKEIEMAGIKNKFSAFCASKNSSLKDMSPGYQSKVWKATKTFSGNTSKAMQNQLTKNNPSFIKAGLLGIVTTGVMVVGGGVSILEKAFRGVKDLVSMFR